MDCGEVLFFAWFSTVCLYDSISVLFVLFLNLFHLLVFSPFIKYMVEIPEFFSNVVNAF